MLGLTALVVGAASLLAGVPAGAQVGGDDPSPSDRDVVDVLQVSGWLDPVLVDFLRRGITDAQRRGVEALIVQLDSPGALVGRDEIAALLDDVADSEVPIAVWIGPSGADALREAGELVEAAHLAGAAPRTTVEVDGRRLGPAEAAEAGVTDLNEEEAAVLGTFIAALDGRRAAGRTLSTADFVEQEDGPPEASLTVQTRLAKLELGPRLLHTVASPPIAYLLLLAGLALVLFELFTVGVGVAAVVGGGSLVLAGYGLAILPVRPIGLALLLLAAFGLAVDVQTGVPRVWTGVGVASLVAGSLLLYDDPVTLGWLPLVGGVAGMVLLMLAGLPATVRSRFSTPTIGRESMVGEAGVVVADLRPQGVVRIREALWVARVNRATPLGPGDSVRVTAVVGKHLEVEAVD